MTEREGGSVFQRDRFGACLECLITLLFLATIAWSFEWSGRVLKSQALAAKVDSDIDRYANLIASRAPSRYALIRTAESAEEAFLLAPNDMSAAFRAAQAWHWIVYFELDRKVQKEASDRAISLYEKAIKLRPGWPYPYRELHALLDFSDSGNRQLDAALLGILKHGFWDPENQLYAFDHLATSTVAYSLSASAYKLPLAQALASNAKIRYGKELAGILSKNGLMAYYCSYIKDSDWRAFNCSR